MSEQNLLSLPEEFVSEMKALLPEEYPSFLESFQKPRTYGLRVNTSRISCEEFERICPFPIRRIPWVSNGYFYDEEARPSRLPYYMAGLYYLQDPSAMTPASRMPVQPGENVLDLCAAPGGKATALGAALHGRGLLIANDISAARARALLRNLELFGIPNIFVTNEKPEKLASKFPGFFHRIMLDAPCSGEGMFRKDASLLRDWRLRKSLELRSVQKKLLSLCCGMLRPGGTILYSTCTYNTGEDEEILLETLSSHPEMELLPFEWYDGFSGGVDPGQKSGSSFPLALPACPGLEKACARLYPHRLEGEGQFFALLRKKDPSAEETDDPAFADQAAKAASPDFPSISGSSHKGKKKAGGKAPSQCRPDRTMRSWIDAFFEELGARTLGGLPLDPDRLEVRQDKVYYLPAEEPDLSGITFLRNGLFLGELKKDRFEPSQPLALAFHRGEAESTISLKVSDERLIRYLHGEAVSLTPEEASGRKGWQLLCVDGYPLAFGRLTGQTLKNKYPAGWRL